MYQQHKIRLCYLSTVNAPRAEDVSYNSAKETDIIDKLDFLQNLTHHISLNKYKIKFSY